MKNEPIDKMLKIGRHHVAGVWRYALPEDFFYFKFPDESRSTCEQCPKIASGYDPVVKCCTYNPRIPNFLLGLALDDKMASRHVSWVVDNSFGTPEGLQQTTIQSQISYKEYSQNNFGMPGQASCNFQNKANGNCEVYAFRNAVCSSFFCLPDFKNESSDFWTSFEAMATQIETALSQWCMAQLGFNLEEYFGVFNDFARSLDRTVEKESGCWSDIFLKRLWKEYYRKEISFYEKCGKLIDDHRDELYEIACSVKLKVPAVYDLAIFDSMDQGGKDEMENHGALPGEPISIEDLWYQLKVSHSKLLRVSNAGR